MIVYNTVYFGSGGGDWHHLLESTEESLARDAVLLIERHEDHGSREIIIFNKDIEDLINALRYMQKAHFGRVEKKSEQDYSCGRPLGCVCGGDTPRVRAGCGFYIP